MMDVRQVMVKAATMELASLYGVVDKEGAPYSRVMAVAKELRKGVLRKDKPLHGGVKKILSAAEKRKQLAMSRRV